MNGQLNLLAKKYSVVKKALEFAKNAHKKQKRLSGEPYIIHPIAVSKIIHSWIGDNPELIAAALLHDVTEDTNVSPQILEIQFGKDIAGLVEGVSKLKSSKRKPDMLKNIQKVMKRGFLDPRVFVLKLADRLHNLQTLESMPKVKQLQKAKESKEVYAHLAESLGMWEVKKELEDLAYKYICPKNYKSIKNEIENDPRVTGFSKKLISDIKKTIPKNLNIKIYPSVNGVAAVEAKKIKNLEMGLTFKKDIFYVNDVVSIRLLTDSIDNCYRILGIIENKYKDLIDENRFDNYLLKSRLNGYSALQTTIKTNFGAVEIAITTHQREDFNRHGILMLLRDKVINRLETYSMKVLFSQKGEVFYLPKEARVIDLVFTYPEFFKHSKDVIIDGKVYGYRQKIPNGAIFKTIFSRKKSRIDFSEALNYCLPTTRPLILKAQRVQIRENLRKSGHKLMQNILKSRGVLNLGDIEDIATKLFYETKSETMDKFYLNLGLGLITPEEIIKYLDEIGFIKEKNLLTTVSLSGKNKSGIMAFITKEIARLGGDIRWLSENMENVSNFKMRILIYGLDKASEERLLAKLRSSGLFSNILLV